MSSDAMGKEYPDQAQRFAVCTSLFDRRKAKASMVVHAGDDEYLVMASEPATKLSVPENWDKSDEWSTKDWTCWCGANDWENSLTAVAFMFGSHDVGRGTKRVWGHIGENPTQPDGDYDREHGANVIQAWVDAAKTARKAQAVKDGFDSSYGLEKHFLSTATGIAGLRGHGLEKVQWVQATASYAVIPPTVKSAPGDPIGDNGADNPNSAPPAAPFPATVAPKSSQPKGDDGSTPPPGNGHPSDTYTGYVGGEEMARKVEPAKLPNPEGGALDPNADNATTIPKGGVDSYDDRSAKPGINQLNWLIANKRLQFKVDPRTSLAVWPLSFEQIETDFKRPNKDPNVPGAIDHAKELDPVKDYADNKPYVI